ncbi:MAG: hypothetical protein ACRDX9_05115 [Acidimicrobiia bacterium]
MLGGAVRRVTTAALAGVVVLAAGACGDDDGDEESTDQTAASTTAAPTTSTVDPSAEVEAAYLAYWDAYLEAVAEPVNPELPELQALMTGGHRRVVTRNLRNMQANALAVREREDSRYRNVFETVEFADEAAKFTACSYDDLVTYDVATGEAVDDSVATKWLEGRMILEDDRWKVAQLEIVSRETGNDQCSV